jgi:TM2 domain-containing membrane protein YozV
MVMNTQVPQQKTAITYDKALNYSIWLGLLGADRLYMGDTLLGILKCMTLGGYGIWWLIDISTLRSHKNDWDKWIEDRQHRRDEINQHQQARKLERIQQRALEKERASNGHCPRCDSERLQVASKTSSKQVLGSGSLLTDISSSFKYNATHQKIRTKMVRVCLNCGYEF